MTTAVYGKRAALITGGAKRLGREIGIFLAQQGYDIIVHYNSSTSHAYELKDLIEDRYQRNCLLIQADLYDFSMLQKLMTEVFTTMPYCNVLINNASIFHTMSFHKTTIENFRNNFALHVQVPFFLSQYFANSCKSNGYIINLLDKNFDSKYFAYSLSKKTLAEFTIIAAKELSPKISINGISIGKLLKRNIDHAPASICTNLLNKIKYIIANHAVSGELLSC